MVGVAKTGLRAQVDPVLFAARDLVEKLEGSADRRVAANPRRFGLDLTRARPVGRLE